MIPLEEIRRAQSSIAGAVVRTPLVSLEVEAEAEIYLKLENLQPIGSFKLRGALNAVRQAAPEALADGVVTASAGNMAQGVAWAARLAGVPCTVVVPEHAPATKLAAIRRLGGRVIEVPYERWWETIEESRVEGVAGLFVHPFQDEPVMAGNGTIGLEILEDLPDADTILIPYGGGGLTVGITSAVKGLGARAEVFAVEPDTAAPLTASLAAGVPQTVEYRPSFIDGAGGRTVLPRMWPLVEGLVDGSFTASLDEVAGAIRVLAERSRTIAEGAGALPVALALSGRAGAAGRKIVCVVSGGNIDASTLTTILAGETPGMLL